MLSTQLPLSAPRGANAGAQFPLVLMSEAFVDEACAAVTGSDFAVQLVTGFGLALAQRLDDAGFDALGAQSGCSVTSGADEAGLVSAQQFKDPHSSSRLTVTTSLVLRQSQGELGAMHVRWDMHRELKNWSGPIYLRTPLVTAIAFIVPAIEPEKLTDKSSLLLTHLKRHHARLVAKLVRDNASGAVARLVEVLSP